MTSAEKILRYFVEGLAMSGPPHYTTEELADLARKTLREADQTKEEEEEEEVRAQRLAEMVRQADNALTDIVGDDDYR